MNLSEYFTDIAYKRLSAVEAEATRSHQHELNGIGALRKIFGAEKRRFKAKFIYLAESQEEPLVADVTMTWYDAREEHPTRTEYRLYYQDNPINERLKEGDLVVIALRPDKEVYFFIAQGGSTYANQLGLLFELSDDLGAIIRIKDLRENPERVDFVRSFILGEIGIEAGQSDDNYLDAMLARFSDGFPKTLEFSDFARRTLPPQDVKNNPDGALISWMEREELLFRTYERHLVGETIKGGVTDVDNFINLSLSVQNRRKSRVGHALENHLEKIFRDLEVSFSWRKETENKAKPDFIFPGIDEYRDSSFPEDKLFMLGVKSTCKDRWRQVLAEASRIKNKHLLTLEPGISVSQTDEMRANSLKLVMPKPLFASYSDLQQKWLISLKDFIDIVTH